ncbi:MAG: 3-dehydroquinate synthase II, partial [Thermoplasmata archaeon]|nr:3-dehydroquinate synthase II [Thermoplasmata archaeon]
MVHHAFRRGFRQFVVPPEVALPSGASRIDERHDQFVRSDQSTIERRTIASPDELELLLDAPRTAGGLAIRWEGERVIPLETVLSRRPKGLELWVEAAHASEVPGLLGALEYGADLVVVDIDTPEGVDLLESALDSEPRAAVTFAEARLTSVRPSGLGDRVIVDTTSLLAPSEGLAVGSSAATLFLVLSEAVGSRYTRPRPFRVNAGAPHSYVLRADGSTRYLGELESGEELLAVDESGESRGVRIGRLKIERRPLTRLEV